MKKYYKSDENHTDEDDIIEAGVDFTMLAIFIIFILSTIK